MPGDVPIELVLMRHANACAPAPGQTDEARELSPTGLAEAARAGAWLDAHCGRPDAILCSPAVRTRQTLRQLMVTGGDWPEPAYEPRIYEAGGQTLLELLDETMRPGDGVSRVWMIGHNPGMQQLALHFDRSDDYRGVPTAAIALATAAVANARLAIAADWRVRRWAP